MKILRVPSYYALIITVAASVTAQVPNPTTNQNSSAQQPPMLNNGEPLYKIQVVANNNITAQGYGKDDPVANNATASGRAKNRRVQLVVSGAAIGIQQSQPGASGAAAQPGMPGQPGTGATRPSQGASATPQQQ